MPQPVYGAAARMANPNIAGGLFQPGTKVQVGGHRVVIEKYLSEGGFAHVYVAKVPTSSGGSYSAVLKRVAVPDKDALAEMKTEVETMKRLKGHRHIVTYIDSHASTLKTGGYEVFLLMEYCNGGGLIDFMNTRLKVRLTEPEILKIFSHAAEGVATMHYLKPPLLHRDLKVENILISNVGNSTTYKLCDFGSSAPPRPPASTAHEGKLIEEDIQKHTTMQYRSPEMIDVYRKRPIDEKSDIWALGVLLYKLCYYTTPFEEQGQMAILTASFRYPSYPVFSDRIKLLIAQMLGEDPKRRPNIYQVLKEVCEMRGIEVPIKDIYAERTHSEVRSNQRLPPAEPQVKSPPLVGARHEAPVAKTQALPEITPMRRGRPISSKPETASKSTDPFAALDATDYATRVKAVDELSSKFPAVEDFSLLQAKGSKFEFDAGSSGDGSDAFNRRISIALADEAFAVDKSRPDQSLPIRSSSLRKSTETDRPLVPPKDASVAGRPSVAAKPSVVPSTKASEVWKVPVVSQKPIWRVPQSSDRAASLGLSSSDVQKSSPLIEAHSATPSHTGPSPPRSPVSSRPSLESLRPAPLEGLSSLHRSRSAHESGRPSSRRNSRAEPPPSGQFLAPSHATQAYRGNSQERLSPKISNQSDPVVEEPAIRSSIDYLRALEEEDASQRHHRRTPSTKRAKHGSSASLSLSGTKNMIAGRFNDAFKRFESGAAGLRSSSPNPQAETTPKPSPRPELENVNPLAFEENAVEDTEDLSPEVRRELERRRLSQEEKRVAEAREAFRRKWGEEPDPSKMNNPRGTVGKASAIQDRVKNLLDESNKEIQPRRTAEGYGRYTAVEDRRPEELPPALLSSTRHALVRETPPLPAASAPAEASLAARHLVPEATAPARTSQTATKVTASRPLAPPKPNKLRTGGPNTSIRRAATEGFGEPGTASGEDAETNFHKRYPSISLEMVETEIVTDRQPRMQTEGLRIKDV